VKREGWGRRDWLVVAGLAAVAVLVWWRVIFLKQWSFGVELDFLRQFYPARSFAARSLGAGTFPLWNQYVLSGYPYFASYQTAMLYPFNLLMVGLYGAAGADFSLKAQCGFVVFHFFLAGVFTYALARDLLVRRPAAVVAALTFMFCGYLVAHAGHINQQSASAWIPLVFLLFRRSLYGRKISYAAGAGAALGVALLAGHFQPLFYLCLFLLLFVVYTAVRRAQGDARKAGLGFGLAALAVTVVSAVGLASVQLLPTYQMIGLSSRRTLPFDIAATYSLPRRELITLVFPHFYGMHTTQYFGAWAPLKWEVYGYSGIVAGTLGVVALLRRRRALAIFLWIVLLAAVILALGPGGYLYTALFRSHLLFDRFRDPARTFVVYGFATALLAGLGTDHLLGLFSTRLEALRRRRAVILVGIVLALVLVLVGVTLFHYLAARGAPNEARARVELTSVVLPTLFLALLFVLLLLFSRAGARAGSRHAGILGACLVALVLVDLVVLNVPWVLRTINPYDPFGDRRAAEAIAARPGVYRVETDASTMYQALDDGAIYGLEKAAGDDSLVLEDYTRYRDLIAPSVSPGVQIGLFHLPGLRSPLLDAMNDRYFISYDPLDPALAAGKFRLLGRIDGVYIYDNRTVLPRARMSDAAVVADGEAAFRVLARTGGTGLADTAVVVGGPGTGLVPGTTITSGEGPVAVTAQAPNSLRIRTDPSCRGLLVVSDVGYQGWEVYVDGKKSQVLQADFLFRGVLLPGGQKTVEFRFRPRSMYYGMVLSLVTLVLMAAYAIALAVRGRRKKANGESAYA
jgi:Bacterial membrane protein YfhO